MLRIGHRATVLAAHWRDQQHVRRTAIKVEPGIDILAQHRRCKRPKALAVLDLEIEHLLHARGARIAKDGAVAERAWAELHAALHPAHGFPIRKSLRSIGDQLVT